jgi:ferritin
MTKEQITKRVEKLDQKASELVGIINTLKEYQAKCEKRINEAYEMANYPNQKFAKEWESEQHHEERNLSNFVRALTDYSKQLDKVCAEIERLEKEKARG